jgi:hypothetical protein
MAGGESCPYKEVDLKRIGRCGVVLSEPTVGGFAGLRARPGQWWNVVERFFPLQTVRCQAGRPRRSNLGLSAVQAALRP